jgi:isopentenyldiphosphate isomerase
MIKTEFFPIVNDAGETIGKATRLDCHSGSFMLHSVVHLHVFNSAGELFLQKRSMTKDIQPGKWDTSVGGHVDYGENIETALYREVREELGIIDFEPVFMERYKFVSDREAELVNSYYTIYDGPIQIDPEEISEGKFWTIEEINASIGTDIFTFNFEQEWEKIKERLLEIGISGPEASGVVSD